MHFHAHPTSLAAGVTPPLFGRVECRLSLKM
jgi:hypothetical protein